MSQGFPTPFNYNKIQAIPGPAGPPGSTGPRGVGNGLDVTTYGADNTGVNDCTSAFSGASTAAASDPSGTVYVPAGSFKLSSTQTISGNLKFVPGAVLKPASGQTVTLSGQIYAGEYQQIFDTSLGGSVLLTKAQGISACWFGASPSSSTNGSAAATNLATKTSNTGISTPNGYLRNRVSLPAGRYTLERPIILDANNEILSGVGRNATFLQNRAFVGPCILATGGDNLTLTANDYAGLNSCTFEAAKKIKLHRYGGAWRLDGKSGISFDCIVNLGTQSGSTTIVSSYGESIEGSFEAFGLWTLALDQGFSNTNVGLQFDLTTSSGKVSARTTAGVVASGAWHHIRCDYDGSTMRIFVDGVSQTLTASAQTGNIKQNICEGVLFNSGLGSGFLGLASGSNPPTGKIASMRLAHASRGSSNFTPPTGKYAEDGITKFLLNFDTPDYGSHQGRAIDQSGAMLNAWFPVENQTQIGDLRISDLCIDNIYAGPAVEAFACPLIQVLDVEAHGLSGFVFDNNCYFGVLGRSYARAYDTSGCSVIIGPASNFLSIEDLQAQFSPIGILSCAMFDVSGTSYLTNNSYCNIYADIVFRMSVKGAFFSDEALGTDQKYGVVLRYCSIADFEDSIFGLQGYTDQRQVWIDHTYPSVPNVPRFAFRSCMFNGNVSGANGVFAKNVSSGSMSFNDCNSTISTFYDLDSTASAMVVSLKNEGPQWSSPTKGIWGNVEADLPAPITTSSATSATAFSYAMPDLTNLEMDVIVQAKDTTDTSKCATWSLSASYIRNGGSPTIMGSQDKNAKGTNGGSPPVGWDANIEVSSNNVIVQVTGTTDNIKWQVLPQTMVLT